MNTNLNQLNKLCENSLFSKQKKRPFWQWVLLSASLIIISYLMIIPLLKKERNISMKRLTNNKIDAVASISQSSAIYDIGNNIVTIAEDNQPLNILILGIPGQDNDAPNLTDTILIASVSDNNVFLLSIPRDLIVEISKNGAYTKINALYALNNRNADLIKNKVEKITGLKINHYIVIDLKVIKSLVDAMGGINILVQNDINDKFYPTENHQTQTFEINKGWRYLDGETALKYIRSRHSTSDFDRIARQQQVVEIIKNKLTSDSLNWGIRNITEMYQGLSANIKTDLNILEIWQIWKELKNVPNNQIYSYPIDTNFLISDKMLLGGKEASILRPRAGLENYSEIKKFIKNIFSEN